MSKNVRPTWCHGNCVNAPVGEPPFQQTYNMVCEGCRLADEDEGPECLETGVCEDDGSGDCIHCRCEMPEDEDFDKVDANRKAKAEARSWSDYLKQKKETT